MLPMRNYLPAMAIIFTSAVYFVFQHIYILSANQMNRFWRAGEFMRMMRKK